MLTQNSERQIKCIWEMCKSWKRLLWIKLSYSKAPVSVPQKWKAGFFKKLTLGTVFESPRFWCPFWYPTIYSWSLKWRKKSPDTCGQGLNICYEAKSRNLKCYISFQISLTSIENEGPLFKRSLAYVRRSDFQLPNAFILTPFSWTVSRKQTAKTRKAFVFLK